MPVTGDLLSWTGATECYLLTVMNNNYVASAIWIRIQKDPIWSQH